MSRDYSVLLKAIQETKDITKLSRQELEVVTLILADQAISLSRDLRDALACIEAWQKKTKAINVPNGGLVS